MRHRRRYPLIRSVHGRRQKAFWAGRDIGRRRSMRERFIFRHISLNICRVDGSKKRVVTDRPDHCPLGIVVNHVMTGQTTPRQVPRKIRGMRCWRCADRSTGSARKITLPAVSPDPRYPWRRYPSHAQPNNHVSDLVRTPSAVRRTPSSVRTSARCRDRRCARPPS
jgi:hypothetical protein